MGENLKGSIGGVQFYATAPQTYTVQYANGSGTFTESFQVINVPSSITDGGAAAIDDIVHGIETALVSAGPETGGVSAALAPLVEIGYQWLKSMVFNDDGSVTLMFAYHYVGTAKGGIDPTFWPGGLDPNQWDGVVNGLRQAIATASQYTLENTGVPAGFTGLKIKAPGQPHPGTDRLGDAPLTVMAAYQLIRGQGGTTLVDGVDGASASDVATAIHNLEVNTAPPSSGGSWTEQYLAFGAEAVRDSEAMTVDVEQSSGISKS